MAEAEKPYSPSCERNQAAILEVFQKHFRETDRQVLEIGSGTGQHAVYFGQAIKQVIWQTSDVKENHAGINKWLAEAQLTHVLAPIEYTIGESDWPNFEADVVFSANVLHIISFELVQKFILDLGGNLNSGSRVFFYGPFKYQGQFTSASNADFESWLKNIDPLRGIRDFETIEKLMQKQGFNLQLDISMPANNQFLIFEKT